MDSTMSEESTPTITRRVSDERRTDCCAICLAELPSLFNRWNALEESGNAGIYTVTWCGKVTPEQIRPCPHQRLLHHGLLRESHPSQLPPRASENVKRQAMCALPKRPKIQRPNYVCSSTRPSVGTVSSGCWVSRQRLREEQWLP